MTSRTTNYEVRRVRKERRINHLKASTQMGNEIIGFRVLRNVKLCHIFSERKNRIELDFLYLPFP